MISRTTRQKIKGYLEGFLESQVSKHSLSVEGKDKDEILAAREKNGELKPFHQAILPSVMVSISSFERSFSTSLGTTFEECAYLIALDNHQEAERGKEIIGKASAQCLSEIEKVRRKIDKGEKVDYPEAIKKIVSVSTGAGQAIRTITDVYLKMKNGQEYYFEIKSPKPNKGQGIEVTDRLLRTHAIRKQGPPKV